MPEQGTLKPDRGSLRRDRGVSFIEVLVSIVLLGTTVIGVLAAVRTSVIGARLESDHAKAQQWLQSASENVRDIERLGCDTNLEDVIRSTYQAQLQAGGDNPPGWQDDRLEIIEPIQFWDGTQYLDPPACFETQRRYLQLITLQVKNPDDEIIETVQVVKHG